ncbi:MAG: hypothetical protein KIS87_05115 [Phycisphaeraceae bacterium]|nr:hypothetical protein [Phycisphaeraceae bacterium]
MRSRFTSLAGALAVFVGATAGSALAQLRNVFPPTDQVSQEMGLRDCSVQRLVIPDQAGDSFSVTITLNGAPRTLDLYPWSFASPKARVQIDDGSGVLKDIDLPEPRTYRGYDSNGPGLAVAGSLLDDGLTLTIIDLTTDQAWHVQPLRDVIPGVDRTLHVVYDAADVIDLGLHQCGGGILTGPDARIDIPTDGNGGTRANLICEIAVDGDFHFFQLNGNSEQNTISDINSVMAGVSLAYETYCGVTFQITHYIIRTSSQSNPYTTNNPNQLLTQFQNWWNANAQGVHRDVAHLFTGRNIDGSVIGIAYMSVICNITSAYGLSQSRFTNIYNSRVALTAHEVGHNFSAPHCDTSPPCHIMCSGLGGCNGIGNPPRFGAFSIGRIVPYAQSRPCLHPEDEEIILAPPILDKFATTTIDPDLWGTINGAVINTDGVNEPSPPNSLNLDANDSIETKDIKLTEVLEQPFVTLFTQHRGVEAGKSLKVQYRDFFQNWVDLVTFTSDGVDRDYYSWSISHIPVIGWHDTFRVRMIAQGADASDDWYIDDFYVGYFRGIEIPFLESVPEPSLRPWIWKSTSNATASNAGVNPPTAPYSLRIVSNGTAETQHYLLATAPINTHVSFYVQHRGVEAGKQLVAEYRDVFLNWSPLATFTSNGTNQEKFTFFQNTLNFLAYHDNFAIRFRALGADASDAWFIDNIFVGPALPPPDDEEDCPADFNGDTVVNTLDFVAFLNAFSAGNSSADFNGDTVVNTLDFVAFLNAFTAGCD